MVNSVSPLRSKDHWESCPSPQLWGRFGIPAPPWIQIAQSGKKKNTQIKEVASDIHLNSLEIFRFTTIL